MSRRIAKKYYLDKIESYELRISVVGMGYVGFPLAVLFASKGFDVTGYDLSEQKVDMANRRENYLPEEPWITSMIKDVPRFKASTNIDEAGDSDFVIIAVPTPADRESKTPIYDYVRAASMSVAKNLRRGCIVSLESTVGPGTTENIVRPILEEISGLRAGDDFGLVYSPERVNPGDPDHHIFNTPKVLGAFDKISSELGSKVYSSIVPEVIHVSTTKEAELVKLLENTQRDVNIALINEFAKVCDAECANVREIIKAASTKWNFMQVYPGCGVGGHCLPDDPWFLMQSSEKNGFSPKLMRLARETNDDMPIYAVDKCAAMLHAKGKSIENSRICVLGLTYKENVSDIRNSPSESIARELVRRGAKVIACDPCARLCDIETVSDAESALKECDAAILSVAHKEYLRINPKMLSKIAPDSVFVDGRNVFNAKDFESAKVAYCGIGCGNEWGFR